MKVLHVATRHRRGGAERNLVHAVRTQQAQGHEVHVVLGAESRVDDFPGGSPVHVLPTLVRDLSPVNDLRAYSALKRLVAEQAFDVVHTHQSKAGVLGRQAARRRGPVIVHTVHMPSFGAGYRPLPSRAFLASERYCAGFTDVIVTVGEELVGQYVAAGVGSLDQYVVIRSPIEIDRFAALRAADEAVRRSWRASFGIAADERVILAVGALDARKRHGLAVTRLAPLLRRGGIRLIVAGEGPCASALTRLVGTLGVTSTVDFPGYVPEVAALFGSADVLIHTSEVEGTPQAVIQALAAGVPVVATDAEGLREVEAAPITVCDRAGTELLDAVAAILDGPRPEPVALTTLSEWSPERVDAAWGALSETLERRLQAKSAPWRSGS